MRRRASTRRLWSPVRLSSAGVSEVKQSHRPTGEVEEVTILGYPDIRVSRIKNVVIVAVCPLRRKIHPISERRRGTEDEGWRKGERGKDFKAMEEEQLRVKERGREEEGKEGGRGRKREEGKEEDGRDGRVGSGGAVW